MQSKLTLRLDDELIREAKALARQRGTSLSQLVADYFRALSRSRRDKPEDEDLPPLTRSLAGALADANVDEEDYRAHLDRKHR
jgi:3-oxoacyl-(acyl-carrier-protein) synthase